MKNKYDCKGWKRRCDDCNECIEVGLLISNGKGAERCKLCMEKRIQHKLKWLQENRTMTPEDYNYYHPDY